MLTHKIPQGITFPFMSPFLGQHQNRLDAKGRVSVPAAYRTALKVMTGSSELILRPSHTHSCIEAWPTTKFNELENTLNVLDVLGEEYDDLSTAIYADAYPLEADKDGRILLPESLVAHAGLTDAVVFVGKGSIFQIWEPAAAAARTAEARERTRARKQGAPARVPAALPAALPTAGGG
jgi:MraZ protein